MFYLWCIATLAGGFIVFGGLGKLALKSYEANKLSSSATRVLMNASMFCWLITGVFIVAAVAFRIHPWLGWVVVIFEAMWFLADALHRVPQGTNHALAVAQDRGQPEVPDSLKEMVNKAKLAHADPDVEFERNIEEAIKVIREEGVASTSLLKVHLHIGYGRAARIIERLEDMGIVGPSDGINPRKVNL